MCRGKNHLNRKSPSCLRLGKLGFRVMELSQEVWIPAEIYCTHVTTQKTNH